MPLVDSRPALSRELERRDIADVIGGQWSALKVLIEAWWGDYKAWEEGDDFETAFFDRRMTVRYTKRGLTEKLVMQARPPGGDQREFPKPVRVERGVAAAWASRNAPPEKFEVDVSMKGITKRTTPGNFVSPQGGASRKAELGLHDLSGSLLRPQQITPQLYNKPDPADRYVFMPLAQEEDQAVFQRLNGLAKELRVRKPEFYALIRGYRSLMTRVKLACEHDMGTNFIALAPDSTINPRFRYGIGPLTKVPKRVDGREIGELESDVANSDDLIRARKAAAINYKQILARELFTVNEITIAYRKHGNPGFRSLFPIFATWDGVAFQTFTMNPVTAAMGAGGHVISDDGHFR